MDIRLGICLPLNNDMVHSQFLDSFIRMEKPDYTYHRPQFPANATANIAAIRNGIVRSALEADRTHILTMDTDQTYPVDTITKLLKHAEAGCKIVTAKVHRRYPPFDPLLLRGEVDHYEMVPDEEWMKGGLIKIDATGSACMLVDTNVFLDMDYPWYEDGVSPEGKALGEDINFCYKARKMGFDIWADTSILVGHLALVEIGTVFYEITKLMDRARKNRVQYQNSED